MTSSISGTEHFVGAIDDRASVFNSVTLVPTGIGEAFGTGSVIYLSTVQIGSAVSSSSVNTVTAPSTPSSVDIVASHGKSYLDDHGYYHRWFWIHALLW
jgi:hypothetical protein